MKSIHNIAAWLVRIEGVSLLLIAVYLMIRGLTSDLTEGDALTAEVVFSLLGGVGLLIASRGFSKQRNFGRGATVLTNLIALGLSYYMFDAGRIWWGISLGILGAATLVAALAAIPRPPSKSPEE